MPRHQQENGSLSAAAAEKDTRSSKRYYRPDQGSDGDSPSPKRLDARESDDAQPLRRTRSHSLGPNQEMSSPAAGAAAGLASSPSVVELQKKEVALASGYKLVDCVIVGSSPTAIAAALKLCDEGAKVLVITRAKKLFPDLLQRDEEDPFSTTAVAPMRGCWAAGHYPSSPETIKEILTSVFEMFRAYPDLVTNLVRQRTNYIYYKGSPIAWHEVKNGLSALKRMYTEFYNAEENKEISEHLPPPKDLFRIVEKKEIPSLNLRMADEDIEQIEYVIVMAEGIVDTAPMLRAMDEQVKRLTQVDPDTKERALQIKYEHKVTEVMQTTPKFAYVRAKSSSPERDSDYLAVTRTFAVVAWTANDGIMQRSGQYAYADEEKGSVRGRYQSLSAKAVRLKQIIYGLIRVDVVKSRNKYEISELSSDGLVDSTFCGYSKEVSCMIAVLDNKVFEVDGVDYYRFRATYAPYTNRVAVNNDDPDMTARLIAFLRGHETSKKEVESVIFKEIRRRFKLEPEHIKLMGSHFGEVITGSIGGLPMASSLRSIFFKEQKDSVTHEQLGWQKVSHTSPRGIRYIWRFLNKTLSSSSDAISQAMNTKNSAFNTREGLHIERWMAEKDQQVVGLFAWTMKALHSERLAGMIFAALVTAAKAGTDLRVSAKDVLLNPQRVLPVSMHEFLPHKAEDDRPEPHMVLRSHHPHFSSVFERMIVVGDEYEPASSGEASPVPDEPSAGGERQPPPVKNTIQVLSGGRVELMRLLQNNSSRLGLRTPTPQPNPTPSGSPLTPRPPRRPSQGHSGGGEPASVEPGAQPPRSPHS